MFKKIPLLTLSLLLSAGIEHNANASLIRTRFQLNSNLISTKKLLISGLSGQPFKGSKTAKLADFSVDDTVQIKVSGINVTLNYEFLPPVYSEQTDEATIQSKSVSADLLVDQVDVHQVFYVGTDNNRMEVKLDAVCKNVKLALPQNKETKVDAKLKVQFENGRPKISVIDFKPNWEPGSWQVVSMTCEGPENFDKQIKIAAEEKLRAIDPFMDSIQKAIQEKLNEQTNQALQFPLEVQYDGQPVTITLNIDRITQMDAEFLTTTGTTEFEFGGSKSRDQDCNADILNQEIKTQGHEARGNYLYFPYAAVKALLACSFKNGNLKFNFLSSDIGPFQELRKEDAKISVVWPDLTNWKDKDFKFEGELTDRPIIKQESFDSDLTMSAVVSAPLKATMFLPKSYYSIPYMHFATKLNGLINFRMKNGFIWMYIDKKFPVKIDWTWDETYYRRYEPNPYVGMSMIEKGIKEKMVSPGFSVPLPTLEPSKTAKEKIKLMDGDFLGSTVRVRFEFVPNKP